MSDKDLYPLKVVPGPIDNTTNKRKYEFISGTGGQSVTMPTSCPFEVNTKEEVKWVEDMKVAVIVERLKELLKKRLTDNNLAHRYQTVLFDAQVKWVEEVEEVKDWLDSAIEEIQKNT
eukprot:PhF_6_TR34269/c0_g1_i1/m.50250